MKRISLLISIIVLLWPAWSRADEMCEKVTWLKSVVLFCENKAEESGAHCGEVENLVVDRLDRNARIARVERRNILEKVSPENLRKVPLASDDCTAVRRTTGASHLLKFKFSFPPGKDENDPGTLEIRYQLVSLLTGETESGAVTNSGGPLRDADYFTRLGKCRWRMTGGQDDGSKSASPVPPSIPFK